MGGHITIRQVTSMDRKLEVRERMRRRYAFKNYPDEFNFRCKCIVVFQNLDGVDVMLFGLYVYEHDEKNPEPNKRTVYISYLDSVHYMRPRQMRTFIYHEILISYLDYVRKRGFSSAHIWACPPLKGDDYILYAKPEDQKTPKDDRLRQWYIDMLIESQRRGVVGKLTNMYDLYFSNPKNDATVVPYMDGDYFPAEVENIIKDIEEGKTGKKGSSQGKKKKGNNKQKQKKKSGRGGTRSTGLDEEALKASGILPAGLDGKSIEEGGRDYVMVKLGETIQPMKESFIVAFLARKGAKKEDMVVPKDIEEYRQKHGIKCLSQGERPEEKNAGDSKQEAVKKEDSPEVAEGTSNEDGSAQEADVVKKDGDITMKDAEKKDNTEDADNNDSTATAEEASKKGEEGAKEGDATMEDASKKDEGAAADDVNKANGEPKADDASKKGDETERKDGDALKKEDSEDSEEKKVPTDAAKSKEERKTPDKAEESKPTEEPSSKADAAATVKLELNAEAADVAKDSKEASTAAAIDGSSEKERAEGEVKTPGQNATENNESTEAKNGQENKDVKHGEETKKNASASAVDIDGDAKMIDANPAPTETRTSPTSAPAPAPAGNNQQQNPMTIREGKFAAMAARKRDLEGNKKDSGDEEEKEEKKPSKTITVKDSKGRTVKVIDDDEEEMDCEFLNNRQAFLNLCQGNHYQFDELRRAKHSSMMVLWHLHNRDAPKFVQQCATCSREILTGYRFHCPTCADFDQCQECVSNPKVTRHPHQLKPIPIASGQQPELTEEQRKERQRSIQLHMTLLLHAATCTSTKCPSANCTKMKGLLKHGAQCQIKATGGCNVCKRIWALLQIHARQCKTSTCPVPNCMAIRERVRQLKKQQQAMDDRRRQEMNRAYGR